MEVNGEVLAVSLMEKDAKKQVAHQKASGIEKSSSSLTMM